MFLSLQTPEEYAAATGAEALQDIRDSEFKSLDDLIDVRMSLLLRVKTHLSRCFSPRK